MNRRWLPLQGLAVLSALLLAWIAPRAEQRFSALVGPVQVKDVAAARPLVLPYITWGGDVATFYANGGLETKAGSIFAKQGLAFRMTAGDDFVQQVRDYMAGKTPFLRGTFSMIGLASEVIGSDPRTKGVTLLQMTWSAGDHMVARPTIKSLNDMRGKKIALQNGGPHVGMLDDALRTAGVSWDDIQIVWCDALTGDKGPAVQFRKDPSIDACFVITPDMYGLTGGPEAVGSGAEGTVKDARVALSTAQLSHSIADVYVCRKDFYDANKPMLQKFVAGYLKACEEIVRMKKEHEAKGSADYQKVLQMTQDIYGKEVIPTLEDASGLISDCAFVGYPGNVKFFLEGSNPIGFEAFQKAALDLATSRGWAGVRTGFFPSGLDYESKDFKGYLTMTDVERGERFDAEAALDEIESLSRGDLLDDRTIYQFVINFEPNQTTFPEEAYGTDFQKVVENAAKYGNAVIAIRGHSDPTKALGDLVKAGLAKGILKRSGSTGNYEYFLNGKKLDLTQTQNLLKLIEDGTFDGADPSPRETAQAARNLSRKRAEAVRTAVLEYAKKKGLDLDVTQIQPIGVGIREPLIAKPRSGEEAQQNMRVEFRLVRVPAEVIKDSDFDF
jgi:outer membrane protein OmpA-like peptidoglycan-associated protein